MNSVFVITLSDPDSEQIEKIISAHPTNAAAQSEVRYLTWVGRGEERIEPVRLDILEVSFTS